jgi:hypothetical protein
LTRARRSTLPIRPGARDRRRHRTHAKIRARGGQAIVTLKTWQILAKSRRCPRRATAIVQAILVPRHIEANRHARQNGFY